MLGLKLNHVSKRGPWWDFMVLLCEILVTLYSRYIAMPYITRHHTQYTKFEGKTSIWTRISRNTPISCPNGRAMGVSRELLRAK